LKKTVVGESRAWAQCAAEATLNKKASDVLLINVKPTLIIVDYFVLASAENPLQLNAMVEAAEEALRTNYGMKPIGREGVNSGSWVLLDYGDIVIHLFTTTTRDYYRIETLFNDSVIIKY